MMKKNLLLMMLILLLGMLAACAPDREEGTKPAEGEKPEATEEPEKPEKLVIWEDLEKSKDWLPAALASFEEEYGIKVEFKELNMADKIRH